MWYPAQRPRFLYNLELILHTTTPRVCMAFGDFWGHGTNPNPLRTFASTKHSALLGRDASQPGKWATSAISTQKCPKRVDSPGGVAYIYIYIHMYVCIYIYTYIFVCTYIIYIHIQAMAGSGSRKISTASASGNWSQTESVQMPAGASLSGGDNPGILRTCRTAAPAGWVHTGH